MTALSARAVITPCLIPTTYEHEGTPLVACSGSSFLVGFPISDSQQHWQALQHVLGASEQINMGSVVWSHQKNFVCSSEMEGKPNKSQLFPLVLCPWGCSKELCLVKLNRSV